MTLAFWARQIDRADLLQTLRLQDGGEDR